MFTITETVYSDIANRKIKELYKFAEEKGGTLGFRDEYYVYENEGCEVCVYPNGNSIISATRHSQILESIRKLNTI